MKTIEERAKEYANWVGVTLFMDSPEEDIIYRDDLARAYVAGAKKQHDELLRWHDPKEELPELLTPVLGKQSDSQNTYYKIVYRHEYDNEDGRYRWTDSEGRPIYVDGWREIHE